MSLRAASAFRGHRTASVFKRYAIRQDTVQRAALEKVAAYLETLPGAPSVRRLSQAK